MTSIPLSDLSSSPAAKFENIGDKYIGTIVSMTERQQTDPATGQVKTFQGGSPRMVWVITLDCDNGETVSLWASGGRYIPAQGSGESMLSAIGTAVKAAGATSVDEGAKLGIAHTGMGEAKPGQNAPRLYTAQYQPPAVKPQQVAVDDLFSS